MLRKKRENGPTPYEGHADVCTMLLENNANANEKWKISATSLFQVVHKDHDNMSTALLENNANTSENMKNNVTTLFQAVHVGSC